jgi:DNA-binding MarR family transcriptional regulator
MIREATRSAHEIAEELRRPLLRLARNLRRETEALGVTSHQVTLLWLVHTQPGLSLRELAAEEGISAPSLSGHVDRLEGAGLLRRADAWAWSSHQRGRRSSSASARGERRGSPSAWRC